MGSRASKFRYNSSSWTDLFISLATGPEITIHVFGSPKSGRTSLKNKADAIIHRIRFKIHIEEVEDLTGTPDGVIIVASARNVDGATETCREFSKAHRRIPLLMFLTHTDLLSSAEMTEVIRRCETGINSSSIIYAPVNTPYLDKKATDADLTLLMAITHISNIVRAS